MRIQRPPRISAPYSAQERKVVRSKCWGHAGAPATELPGTLALLCTRMNTGERAPHGLKTRAMKRDVYVAATSKGALFTLEHEGWSAPTRLGPFNNCATLRGLRGPSRAMHSRRCDHFKWWYEERGGKNDQWLLGLALTSRDELHEIVDRELSVARAQDQLAHRTVAAHRILDQAKDHECGHLLYVIGPSGRTQTSESLLSLRIDPKYRTNWFEDWSDKMLTLTRHLDVRMVTTDNVCPKCLARFDHAAWVKEADAERERQKQERLKRGLPWTDNHGLRGAVFDDHPISNGAFTCAACGWSGAATAAYLWEALRQAGHPDAFKLHETQMAKAVDRFRAVWREKSA